MLSFDEIRAKLMKKRNEVISNQEQDLREKKNEAMENMFQQMLRFMEEMDVGVEDTKVEFIMSFTEMGYAIVRKGTAYSANRDRIILDNPQNIDFGCFVDYCASKYFEYLLTCEVDDVEFDMEAYQKAMDEYDEPCFDESMLRNVNMYYITSVYNASYDDGYVGYDCIPADFMLEYGQYYAIMFSFKLK